MNLVDHLEQQILFSQKTFGPGDRHGGVTDHIRKELIELGAPPSDLEQALLNHAAYFTYPKEVDAILRDRAIRRGQVEHVGDPDEWVDEVILSLDGMWRALDRDAHGNLTAREIAEIIVEKIVGKQAKNEKRDWPDWRTASPDKAIEHDRTGEATDGA